MAEPHQGPGRGVSDPRFSPEVSCSPRLGLPQLETPGPSCFRPFPNRSRKEETVCRASSHTPAHDGAPTCTGECFLSQGLYPPRDFCKERLKHQLGVSIP